MRVSKILPLAPLFLHAGCSGELAVGLPVDDEPAPTRDVVPTVVRGSPTGAFPEQATPKAILLDQLMPHVPAYADLTPIDKENLTAILNTVNAPCVPCESKSFAACIVKTPAGCENLSELIDRTVELVNAGVPPGQVRESVVYTDVWVPVAESGRAVDGDPTGMPLNVWVDPATASVRVVTETLDALDLRSVAITFRIVPFSTDPVHEAWASAAIAAEQQGKLESWLREIRTWRDEQRKVEGDVSIRVSIDDLDVIAATLLSQGLDRARFQTDRTSDATRRRIESDRALANSIGIRVAPSWTVDGYRLRGAQSAYSIQRVIDLERPAYVRRQKAALAGEK